MKSRRFRPESLGLRTLETRALLSTAAHAPSAIVSVLASATLVGTQKGRFTTVAHPDSTSDTTFKVSARSAVLGKYTATGSLHSIGLADDHPTGSVTIRAKAGTLSLSLVGPLATGGSGVTQQPRRG